MKKFKLHIEPTPPLLVDCMAECCRVNVAVRLPCSSTNGPSHTRRCRDFRHLPLHDVVGRIACLGGRSATIVGSIEVFSYSVDLDLCFCILASGRGAAIASEDDGSICRLWWCRKVQKRGRQYQCKTEDSDSYLDDTFHNLIVVARFAFGKTLCYDCELVVLFLTAGSTPTG